MPIYEYKCTVCAERFDVEQSIKDDTLTTIPGDDHEHLVKKVFHPVGIAFKGDGFYKNDSRGRSSSTSPAPASSGDSSSSTSTTTTTESTTKSTTKSESSTPAASSTPKAD